MIYAVCTGLSVGLMVLSRRVSGFSLPEEKKKYLSWLIAALSALPLVLISAIRYDVGTDYQAYVVMWEHPEWFHNFSPLFDLFLMVSRWFSTPQAFFVMSSVFICGAYFYSCYRNSDFPAYSVLLFVVTEDFFVSMNVIRQYMAIGVLLLFLPAFRNRDWKKMIAAVVLAGTIHLGACVVVLFGLLVWFVRPNWKFALGVGAGVGALGLVLLPLLKPLLELTPFGRYFTNHYSTDWYGPTIPMLAIYLCVLLVLSFCCDLNTAREDPNFRLLYHAVTVNLWLMIMALYMPSNFYRMTYFTNAFFVVTFPTALRYMKKDWMKWVVGIGCLCGYALWTVLLLSVGNQDVIPYQTIFG